MELAFLIDSPEKLHVEKDTSIALMLEAESRGHRVFILERGDLTLNDGKLFLRARKVKVFDNPKKPFEFFSYEERAASFFDIIFIRTDPPFNSEYLTDTWLLSHAAFAEAPKEKQPLVLNNPSGLREINEKIWAARFCEFTPPTLITSNIEAYRAFLKKYKTIVAKPTDGFGGSAVFIVRDGDKNAAVVFETLQKLSHTLIIQAYLPAAVEGDKRILLVNGDILGAVLRHHAGDDHRNNFASGGKALETTITEGDRKICAALKPYLLEHGIFFAGIDIIGGKLIEVNVTSPTCLREMQCFYKENLAEKVLVAAEEMAQKKHGR
ncbi:MAG: Glutathione synthetase [Turneriella sp.]|nr:Glutathione synthetase [Turneriella sp.]